jgi:uncharacterized protein YjeT (DUF2065 family)
MIYLLFGLGMVFLIEGLAYALAPSLVERLLEALRSITMEHRRQVGALAAVTGLILIFAAFKLGL